MPFTFKLSKRLARIKRSLTIAAAVFAACEEPIKITDPTPPNSPVVQVVIVPDTVTLNPYQTEHFVAYGRTPAGDSVAAAVSWRASGGAITTDGSYTADTVAGDYLVTATVQLPRTAPTTTASASAPVSGSSQVKNRGLLAQVLVTPSTASVSVGRTVQFSAYGYTKNGDTVAVSVTWSSTNPAVATVSSSGLMTGVAAGSTTIIATSQNKSGTATATVTNVPVASVPVSPAAANVLVGGTAQLSATPQDAAGNALPGRTVTWTSSNVAIATVSATGLVTGVAAGSAIVTATSEGQSGTATITVSNVPVASVVVSPAAANVLVGGTAQLSATPKDAAGNVLAGRTVTWTSSNAAIATVSTTGLVTGVAAGSAIVTATSEGQSGTATVTVSNVPVASVTVSPGSASIIGGATVQLTATVKDAAGNTLTGRTVTWASSNTAVATVSASGLVTGVAAGSATITATSEGKSGTAALTITTAGCVTSAGAWQNSAIPSQTGAFEVQFDATPATANMNGVVGLSNGSAADWTNLAAIVRFNPTGTIDARNGGDYAATTAVPYTAGTTYHFRLDVNLTSHTYDIYVTRTGSAEQLLGSTFAFRTEQAAVSLLNNLGLYASVGSETVCNFAVAPWTPPPPAPVATVTVSPAVASVSVGANIQLLATLTDASGNVLTGRSVTWASSALGMATVSTGGLVTGVAVGVATITATSEGQTGSSAVTVTVASDSTPLFTLGTGANYYVAPSGSDANPCTATAPCYTMARVSQLMRPGDNAHFAAGNYTWSYSGNKVAKSGTATAPISYISDTKWGAKIYGSDCSPIWNDGDYVQIINFDVTGNCSQGITTNGNYSKVIGTRVHDLPGTGGYAGILGDCCSYSKTGIQIIGNVVDNIGPWGATNTIHGIYLGGPNGLITNNIVTRASAACIHLFHGTTHEIISNNVVANCGMFGIEVSAGGGTTNDYTTVNNNIVVNTNGRGIYEYPSTGCNNVYNNNVVYNNAPNLELICGTQSGTVTLTSAQFSALFVNYTGDMRGDYHLRSGAAAIDAGSTRCAAGVTLCVPTLDLDGIARPKGTAYDGGAYEWH